VCYVISKERVYCIAIGNFITFALLADDVTLSVSHLDAPVSLVVEGHRVLLAVEHFCSKSALIQNLGRIF
jgi:hypothetical protein